MGEWLEVSFLLGPVAVVRAREQSKRFLAEQQEQDNQQPVQAAVMAAAVYGLAVAVVMVDAIVVRLQH